MKIAFKFYVRIRKDELISGYVRAEDFETALRIVHEEFPGGKVEMINEEAKIIIL